MPLPENFFEEEKNKQLYRDDLYDPSSIFPDFSESDDIEEKQSLYDSIGEGLWAFGAHFISAGTMGATEFISPTEAWEEKTTSERIGAAVGEAAGMFVPMGLIGKGIRGVAAFGKQGSKTIARQAIKKTTANINDKALKSAVTKGLKKEVFSKEGKRLLYQHELGGEALEGINKTLMENVEASLKSGLKNAKLDVDNATIKSITKGLQEGLMEGKHINSVSSWLHTKVGPMLGSGPKGKWVAKYAGEVAQDAVILGLHGVTMNTLQSAARDDVELNPGSAMKHALMLSFAFPAIRAFGGGGERKMGELWAILKANNKKTNYNKITDPEDLRGILQVLTGGKRKNLIGKKKWTSRISNTTYHVDDFNTISLKSKAVIDDMRDIANQVQNTVGKLDGAKIWGRAYLADTFNLGTIGRMAVGSTIMNLDMFKENAAMFRNLPPQEVLTHLLIGAMMSRGKGGWARDPQSRTGDAKAEEINAYYELMHLAGIDHSKVSEYVKVKNFQDIMIGQHLGLINEPTVEEIEKIYQKYEGKIKGNKPQSSKEVNDIIEEWKLLRESVGLMRGDFRGFNYNLLTPEDRTNFRQELSRVVHNDKPLTDSNYNKFMGEFSLKQADAAGEMYKKFFDKLSRESSEGAGDQVLNNMIDNNGRINHGGINWEHESTEVAQLHRLLSELGKSGQAIKVSNEDFPMVNFAANPKAARRLEQLAQEFRNEMKTMGLGENVDFYFDIGNPESNPFLQSWMDVNFSKGQNRIANMATRLNVEAMEKGDRQFMDIVYENMTDTDGSLVHPTRYRIVDKEGLESRDVELQDKLYGIASAFYQGSSKSKLAPKGRETIDIPEDVVSGIINTYEGLNMPIPADRLYESSHLNYIEARSYDKFDVRPENVRVLKSLEENNLLELDREKGVIFVNSDEAIRNIGKDMSTAEREQYVELHKEITSSLPSNSIQEAPGEIKYPLESGREPNLEALKSIRRMLPEIFEKEISSQIENVLYKSRSVHLDNVIVTAELDMLTKTLANGEFDIAYKHLENIKNQLPGFEKNFEGIYKAIADKAVENLPLDLTVFELSKGTGFVYNAIQEYIASEKIKSNQIEEYLTMLVYKGKGQNAAAINDYNKLFDTLGAKLGSTTDKVSIDQLFEGYLQGNNYSDLQLLMRGLNQLYAGRTNPNNLENQHLVDSMEQMFQNQSPPSVKTKITIGKKYNLLDAYGAIKPKVQELLKAGDLITLKEKYISESMRGSETDQELLSLTEIVRNTREQKIIRFTETVDGEGNPIMVREFVMPWDNTEFNTPSNLTLDRLNDMGIHLIPISKSGVVDGRQQNNISLVADIKQKYEHSGIINRPDERYLSTTIKEDGQLHPRDEIVRRIQMPDGKMRFVEVSLGRPLNFVENAATLESLNNAFSNWFEARRVTYEDGSMAKQNFERVFDPSKVTDPEVKIRAMYLSMLNPEAFNTSFTPEAMDLFSSSKGHLDLNMRMLKYAKLAEGGSLKALPGADQIELYLNTLPDLPANRRESLSRIMDDLRNPDRQIRMGIYADESTDPNNPFTVRLKHLSQVENMQDGPLKDYLRERYSDPDRFKNTMDVSSIDGAIYIDRDMRNLFLSLLSEADYVNGFKGSIAKSGEADMITIYGKGLFIFDPSIATSMENRGVRLVMGESAAKNFNGVSPTGDAIEGRLSTRSLLENDISGLRNNNILKTSFEGMGLRFGGHLGNNAPVPHPYTHYMSEGMVVAVRDGWQMLGEKITEINNFSKALKQSANQELAQAMAAQQEATGMQYEMDTRSFAENMLHLGFTTRNPVVREGIMKMWEEQALPTLMKPRNSKFNYQFVMPDLKSENPVSIDIYKAGDLSKSVAQARIQLGEGLIGEDAKHIPVHGVNELAFSFRSGEVDYIVQYNNQTNKFDFYNPAQEFLSSGKYVSNITSERGGKTTLQFIESVPVEVQDFILNIDRVLKLGNFADQGIPTVYGSETNKPSLEGIQSYIENLSEVSINHALGKQKVFLAKHKIRLIKRVERGPRKGPSDFIPVRLRLRSKAEREDGIGTMEGLNALDVRSNAQGDHDGDKTRSTHDFAPMGNESPKFELLKQDYRLSSNNEEYSILDPGVRKANIFGIGYDKNGDLMHAGSRSVDNIHTLKQEILQDQMAVGKVIGMQSAIEWMSLADMTLNFGTRAESINKKLGFTIDKLVEHGNIFRRLEKANQSAVDFISALNKTLKESPYKYALLGEGEAELTGKLFETVSNDIQKDIFFEIIDVMRKPASIFNQEWSEMGGKPPTSFDIHSHYVKMRKFFEDPNGYIFRRLMFKYKNLDVDAQSKMNQLIPLFFQTTEGKEEMPRNIRELKSLVLQGKAQPTNNIIAFKEQNITKLIRKSNAGLVMDEVVKNSMFKSEELDIAWKPKSNLSYMKQANERFIDEIALLKVIGATNEELMNNHGVIFQVGREKYLRNAEDASLLYDLLGSEESFMHSKLEYQLGFKNANHSVVRGLVDRMDNIAVARNIVESMRKKDVLQEISETQDKYTRDLTKKAGKIINPTNKAQTVYRITGNLYHPDTKAPNPKAIKYETTIRPDGRSKRLQGKFLVLKNPIIGHRMSDEQSIEGYTWHFVHNSTPMFTNKTEFDNYRGASEATAFRLVEIWNKALNQWRDNKAVFTPFTNAVNEKNMTLNNYFKRLNFSKPGKKLLFEENLVKDLSERESMIYYKAKMLLRPNVVPRQYIKGDVELPFMRLHNRIFKEVFSWLHDNGHAEVASRLAKEYNDIKNYISGHTSERTFDLKPSPLYETRYNLDPLKANDALRNVLEGFATPDIQIMLQGVGVGRYEGEILSSKKGEYSIQEIRNWLSNTKENNVDKRKTCRGGI